MLVPIRDSSNAAIPGFSDIVASLDTLNGTNWHLFFSYVQKTEIRIDCEVTGILRHLGQILDGVSQRKRLKRYIGVFVL